MPAIAHRAAIVGLAGPALSPDERRLFDEHPPLGVILFRRNIAEPQQLAGLAAELRDRVPGASMMVDQEGGRVARLRPPHWRAHPPAATLGLLHAQDPAAGRRAAFLTGALIGLDCAAAGFSIVCAPVLDRAVAGADPVIGDRAYAADPEAVAVLAGAVARGLLAAGIQPVGKHAPGHGRAEADSHLVLPELDDVEEADLLPFRSCNWLPWMMTAHIRFPAIDPVHPATLSRAVLEGVVRRRIGFNRVLVSDDLAMHAVRGDPGGLAAAALEAGCDVALHCSGVFGETRAVLERTPPPGAEARRRLAEAAAEAAAEALPLDGPALAAERALLLG